MGTRINVLLDHQFDNYKDRDAVLKCLSQALPEALAVQEYWASVKDNALFGSAKVTQWTADPDPDKEIYQDYTGPGMLFVSVNKGVAWIRTGGRWRGFLSIPGLHAVHLKAFRAIASALGAQTMVYFPDNDDLFELFWEDKPLGECIKTLEQAVGQPQPSIDDISPTIAADTEHGVPNIWYLSASVIV